MITDKPKRKYDAQELKLTQQIMDDLDKLNMLLPKTVNGMNRLWFNHTFDSRRGKAGEPDLRVMVKTCYGWIDSIWFIELKVGKNDETDGQIAFREWVNETRQTWDCKHTKFHSIVATSLDDIMKQTDYFGMNDLKNIYEENGY